MALRTVAAFLLVLAGCGYDTGTRDEITDEDSPAPWDNRPGGNPDAGDGGEPACSNGMDDDCDGLIDFAGGDPGCRSATDTAETEPGLICDDGLDNDADGLIDHALAECGDGDPDCSSPSDNSEQSSPSPL